MKPYIYGSVNGIHVINLLQTVKQIEVVKAELKELSASGKKILFVATKIQSRDSFKKLAEETGHHFVCEKWVPGLLTNFKTIRKRINAYIQLLDESQNGGLNVLTKKEKASKLLELEKLEKAFVGLKDMKKLPDILFVSDGIYEKQSLKEAKTLSIPAYAIFNTNGDIDLVKNMIPANTNSVKSFEYIAADLKSSIVAPRGEKKSGLKVMDQEKVSGEKKPFVAKVTGEDTTSEEAPKAEETETPEA